MRKKNLLFVWLASCLPLIAGASAIAVANLASDKPAAAPPQKMVATTLPYYNDFNEESKLEGWTKINTNRFFTWQWYQYSGYDETPCLYMTQDPAEGKGTASDNWIFSPAFNLKGGFNYRLKFYIKNWFPSNLDIYLMKKIDISEEGTPLFHYEGSEWGDKIVEFEIPADGEYYIAIHDHSPWTFNDTALRYHVYIDNLSLEELSNNAAPEMPGNLLQHPGENGEVSMMLSWVNPSLSKKGEQLDVLSSVQVYKDGVLAETIREGIAPGEKMEWLDTNPTVGVHTYKVSVSNTSGESEFAEVNTYIGVDDPGAPTDVNVDYDSEAGIVTIDWEAPQFGRRGGWFDKTGLSYRVVRQPGNKLLASNLTEQEFEDTDVEDYGNYVYEVTTKTAAGTGGTAVSTGVIIGKTAQLPIIEGWENEATYPVWEIVDNNADGHSFEIIHAFGHDEPSCLAWNYLTTEVETDESIYSAPVKLEKGKKYKATVWIQSNMMGAFSYDLTYGKRKSKSAQTNKIVSQGDVTTGGEYAPIEGEFSVNETGTYYMALRMFNLSHHRLYIDEFRIEEVFDKNVEATSVRNLDKYPSAGDKITTGVNYTNRGTSRTSSFKVQLIDDDNTVLGEQTVSRPVAAGASGTASIEWTVPNVTGRYGIRGRVVMDGDQCEADNTSFPIYLDVQGAGNKAVTIGTSSDLSSALPFNYYAYNFSEFIYEGSEFGNIAGQIKSLKFKVSFGMETDFERVPFRLYVGNTDETDMFKGWLPFYSMKKVFDGTLDLMRGMTEVEIPFEQPFAYSGGNLAVLVEGAHEMSLMLNTGYGMQNYVTEKGLGASRVWPSNAYTRPDVTNPDQSTGRYLSYRPNVTFFVDHSKTVELTGTVTDAEGNPVEGATVQPQMTKLTAVTDADGKYKFPYFNVPSGNGYASFTVTKQGYENGSFFGYVKTDQENVLDCNNFKKCISIILKGTVASAVDNATPIAGAKITLSGDNDFTAVTDAEGNFSIEGVYANKSYPVFTVEADGYKGISWGGQRFYGNTEGQEVTQSNLNLTPITAAPFSVSAIDAGEKAEITWTDPVEDIAISKCSDDLAGMFGAGSGNINIAHRFSPAELKTMGVDGDLVLKAIEFMPMCYSKFTIGVWQGEAGNEAPVYFEDVEAKNYKQWNTFKLTKPFKIDPTKSLLIGIKISSSTGSYPVSFDQGPVKEGGDVLFDPKMNQWTTAHDVMPGQMNYNWGIRGVFGSNSNTAAVPWLEDEAAKAPAKKAVSINDATIAEREMLANSMKEESNELAGLDGVSFKLFDKPMHAPADKAGLKHEYKGFNVYRLLPGQENSTWSWTKLNTEPVSGNSYTDETWGAQENKPYRYAVTTFYGNPYAWGNGVMSDGTLSDGVDKGRYGDLKVNVTTTTGNAEDATVYLSGDGKNLKKVVAKGESSVTFDNMRFTDYTVKVAKPYYNLYSGDVKVEAKEATHDAELAFAAPAPEELDATDYIDEARLGWIAPSAKVGAIFQHSSDVLGQALPFNMGKETTVGGRITPEQREAYNYTDFYIDQIGFYANAATTYYPVVWRRNINNECQIWEKAYKEEEHEIYRQEYKVSPEEVGTWVTVTLDEPVKMNATDTYYYGIAATTTNEVTPLCLDDGSKIDEEGMWYYDFSQKDARYMWICPAMGASWMLRAHITDSPKGQETEALPVTYDLYRFETAKAENESEWTKVNEAPLEGELYNDAAWEKLPDADYQYAVKARYSEDAASASVLSKVLEKGKTSLVNINVTTNNNRTAADAKVAVKAGKNSYYATVDAEGKAQMPEVRGTNGQMTITLPGYEEIKQNVALKAGKVDMNAELIEVKEAPVYLEAVASADNSQVDLTWREPGSYAPAEGWAYWDNGKPYGGFGTSTGFCAVAQAFTAEDLETKHMKEYDITKISFFPTQSKDNPVSETSRWTAKIWRIDMTSGEVTEVATGDGVNVKLDQWNEIVFDAPYHVQDDDNLLIGYEFHGSGNALGIDQGPCAMGRGDWANFGQGWMTLSSSVNNFNYNNLIHAYVEKPADASGKKNVRAEAIGEAQPILKDAKAEVMISKVRQAAAKSAEHPKFAPVKYFHTGYDVYRLPSTEKENTAAWTKLNDAPVSDAKFADKTWKNVSKGSYVWAVKANYVTGESAPAFSLEALNENGSVDAVEGISADGFGIKRISENEYLVTVPAEGTIEASDANGIVILSDSLAEGENNVSIEGNGVILISVKAAGITRNYKMIVK